MFEAETTTRPHLLSCWPTWKYLKLSHTANRQSYKKQSHTTENNTPSRWQQCNQIQADEVCRITCRLRNRQQMRDVFPTLLDTHPYACNLILTNHTAFWTEVTKTCTDIQHLPYDVLHARACVLWPCVCPFVGLSVTLMHCVKATGYINQFLHRLAVSSSFLLSRNIKA